MRRGVWISSVAASVAAFSGLAQAQDRVVTPHATVTLVSETAAATPGQPFRLGLRFQLADGWHIYWINPGAAGDPPRADYALPEGARASGFAFPTPQRLRESDAVMSYAYLGDVLLPFTVTPPARLTSFSIKAKASWLVCGQICVPEQGDLTLDLPVGAASPSPQAPLFAATDARAPKPSRATATLSATGVLTVKGDDVAGAREAWFLPATQAAIDDGAPQPLSLAPGQASLKLKPGEAFDAKAPLAGILAVKDAAGAERDVSIVAAPESGPAVTPRADASLASLLGLAFLGGLILNLMPCVFPILALKAIGLAQIAGGRRGAARAAAGAYTLGVLVAFAGLAGALIGLRAAGASVGWGFQFQSPAFVAVMAWLLFALGLNLSGVFEIGGGWVGAGASLASRGGLAGSFFTGLLAVTVATPCTAPFMGAAVAAAAVAPAAAALMIFLAMGLGLAAPYGALALIPALARALPRPGRWMLTLKQALAFPMYAAAVWLAWVVSRQAGADAGLIVLSGALLLGFAAWLYGATREHGARGRALGAAFAAVAAGLALTTTAGLAGLPQPAAADEASAYSADRLATLRAQGRPVFVNMTADWCVTCLVNEKLALSSPAVRDAFAKRNVAYLKGDWTRADPAIARFLRDHGREGVPLYVLYPARAEALVVLPQILTSASVLDELDRSGG